MSVLRGAEVDHQKTKKDNVLRRAGIDPVAVDPRSLSEIMDDSIPYERWNREQLVIKRAGYENWIELLEDRYAENRKRPKLRTNYPSR